MARNPIWTVPNEPLASAPGKEFHHPILSNLTIHECQVNKERDVKNLEEFLMIFLLLHVHYLKGKEFGGRFV